MSTRDDQRPSPEPVPESMIDAAEAPTVEASDEVPDSFDEILKRVVQPAAATPVLDTRSTACSRRSRGDRYLAAS